MTQLLPMVRVNQVLEQGVEILYDQDDVCIGIAILSVRVRAFLAYG
jgi:hypothetical protein